VPSGGAIAEPEPHPTLIPRANQVIPAERRRNDVMKAPMRRPE
jgi:hypothetical protein